MLNLVRIPPPNKLPTTVKSLKLHHIPEWMYDISEDIKLGNAYYPALKGVAPANLVPLHVPSIVPPEIPLLPRYTRDSEAARDVNNWRAPPVEEP